MKKIYFTHLAFEDQIFGLLYFAQDPQYLRKLRLLLSMRNICARFAEDCTSFPNPQEMRKICTRLYFSLQCVIYAQDLHKMHFFPQCAIYAQDCTSLPNVLGPFTIYALNIIIHQVIKFFIFLFKLTGNYIQ